MSADIIQFIPRPNHKRDTDFPSYAFKTETRENILQQQAIEIMNVALIEGPHEKAIYESSLGFIEDEPA